MPNVSPQNLAADGDRVDLGIPAPDEQELLQYLADRGFHAGDHVLFPSKYHPQAQAQVEGDGHADD